MRRTRQQIFIFTATLMLIFVGAFSLAHAQNDSTFTTNPGAVRDSDISVDILPEVPGPNQNVKITVSSYATNLNKATITWTKDGKTALSGTGKTSFSFTTGDVGTETQISIALILEENSRVDKIITIKPSQVDILWEASESHVPPFYKGKALPIKESRIKVVALPVEKDGSIQPFTKVYNWKKNFVVDQNGSGYGKYAFTYRNSYMDQTDTVSLTTSSQTGSGTAGDITLNYVNPLLLVYENSPVFGLRLNKLLNNGFNLPSGEINVSVQPFYFSETKGSVTGKNMQYTWIINGTNVTPPSLPNELTLRVNNDTGVATIALSATNISTLFQQAKQTISLTLGNK